MSYYPDHAPHAPGPRPETWGKRQLARVCSAMFRRSGYPTPLIYTAPAPAVQRPVASNSKDRNGYRRHPFGGTTREKGKQ